MKSMFSRCFLEELEKSEDEEVRTSAQEVRSWFLQLSWFVMAPSLLMSKTK